jgi:signal transduction histidine kinase
MMVRKIFFKYPINFNIFKDIKTRYKAEFHQQILAINISRIKTISPIILVLSVLFFIVADLIQSPQIYSPKLFIHVSLSLFFLIVIIFINKIKSVSQIKIVTGYFLVYLYVAIITLHVIALSLLAYEPLAIYAFLVPVVGFMVGFYWPLLHIIVYIIISTISFFAFHALFTQPADAETSGLYLFYILLFFFISRTYYLVKVQEFEHIKKLFIQTTLLEEKNRKIDIARKELLSKNHELDNFVYRASHDLLGPVSSILGLHNVVTMEIKEQNALNYFNIFNSQATRMNEIILSLIEITKIKEAKLTLEPVDFKAIISNAYERFSKYSVFYEFKFYIDVDLDELFVTDKEVMQMVFNHLIDNSLKYRRKRVDSYVRINIYKNNERGVIIQFSDNGLGISRSIQHRIFSMFFRGIESSQGSGLGLYMIKTGLHKLNGSITYNSVENEGTTFTIELPYLQPDKFFNDKLEAFKKNI